MADRLFSEKRMMPLVGKIRRSRDLHSLATDLVMALESLDALDQLSVNAADPNDHTRLITESALLNNALVLYVRATKTESEERGGFDLRSRFDDQEKALHRELSDLRDCAIAHYGSGGTYGGEWQAELVILQFSGEDAKPGVVTRRQTLDPHLARRARVQIERALFLMRQIYHVRLNEVTNELNAAGLADPAFCKEIERHPLNFEIFLKSSEAANAARASYDHGYAKGTVAQS